MAPSTTTQQLIKRGGPGGVPGSLPHNGPCQLGKQQWTHDISYKQTPNSFTLPVVYLRCLFFFSWAISGLTGLRAEQSWGSEPTGRERDQWVKGGFSPFQQDWEGSWPGTPVGCSGTNPCPSPGLCPSTGLNLLNPLFQSKMLLFFTFGSFFLNVL